MLWRSQHVTKQVLKKIKTEIDENRNALVEGNITDTKLDDIATTYVRRVGYIRGLSFIFKILEEVEETENVEI